MKDIRTLMRKKANKMMDLVIRTKLSVYELGTLDLKQENKKIQDVLMKDILERLEQIQRLHYDSMNEIIEEVKKKK